MNAQSSSLLVPFTFTQLLDQKTNNEAEPRLLDTSCSRTQPRTVKSWGALSNYVLETGLDDDQSGGVIVGSQDGTLYLFHHSRRPPLHVGSQNPEFQISQPTSPSRRSRDSGAPSRSSTPSVTSPSPFNVTPRSRVVSGVTTEQVEAPKNYVDFDDEPERLKDMLKGRHPKGGGEKPSFPEGETPPIEKSPTPSLLGLSGLKRKNVPRSMLSATQSPAILSSPLSSNSSPRASTFLDSVHDLHLWCHIIPPRSGSGRAVTSIRLLEDDQFMAVLQEMG